jgi:hypothetical protein
MQKRLLLPEMDDERIATQRRCPGDMEAGTPTIYTANLISYSDPLLTTVKILSMSFAIIMFNTLIFGFPSPTFW